MNIMEFDKLYENFPYVLSLCEAPNIPYMWFKYADYGRGVVLALSYDAMLAESQRYYKSSDKKDKEEDFLFKVRYSTSDKLLSDFKNLVEDFNRRYAIACDEAVSDLQACAFIKKTKYKKEHEWRYARIRESQMTFSKTDDAGCIVRNEEDRHGVQYRSRDNESIPYLTIDFQPCTLKKICYIPYLLPKGGIENIQYLLNSVMYSDVLIAPQNIKI